MWLILLWVTPVPQGIIPRYPACGLQFIPRHAFLQSVLHLFPFFPILETGAPDETFTKKNGVHNMHSVGKSTLNLNYIGDQPVGMVESDAEAGASGTLAACNVVPGTPSLWKLLVMALVVP